MTTNTRRGFLGTLTGLFASHNRAEDKRKIRILRDALLMKGAPESPCAKCRDAGNCRVCGCSCHRERGQYVMALHAKALEETA